MNEKILEPVVGQIYAPRREALLHLHKTLIDSERKSYEAVFGKINSPYQVLQLVTNDPWFAWLQPFSQLITAIDENLAGKNRGTVSDLNSLFRRARELLVASEIGEGFSRHYFDALQRDPDVVFAHAEAAKLLRKNS